MYIYYQFEFCLVEDPINEHFEIGPIFFLFRDIKHLKDQCPLVV